MEIRLDSRRLTILLTGASLLFVVLHVLGKVFVSFGYVSVFGFVQMFDLDVEGNVPSYFAVLLWLFAAILCGAIAAVIRQSNRPYPVYWIGLVFIFLFLSMDEYIELHELITGLIQLRFKTSGIFYSAWIIPYGILLGLFVSAYFKFWLRLPGRTRILFLIAGIVYASGAMALEIAGEALSERNLEQTFAFQACVTLEELLEMIGVVILIHALLSYLRDQLSDSSLQLKVR